MEEKLVTIIVLPFSQAQILRTRLEENNIECYLEDLTVLEGSSSYSVKVKILEEKVQQALPVLDEFLGEKQKTSAGAEDKKDQHILVPIDFSPVSLKTSKIAFNIASHLNYKLVFMHCYINPIIHTIPYSDVYVYDSALLMKMDNAEKLAHENLQKFITDLSAGIGMERWGSVTSEFIVKAGYADEDILAYAQNNNSQLIVIGTGGESENVVVGSITADVIYNAPVPVLVIPGKNSCKRN